MDPAPDPATLVRDCHDELAAIYPRLSGFDALLAGDVTLTAVGAPYSWLNQASGARFTEVSADSRIDEVIAWFDSRGLPFSWEVGPADSPADLGDRLAARGLQPDHDEAPGMVASLSGLPAVDPPSGTTIEIVRDPTAFDDWLGAFRDAFAMPADLVAAFSKLRLLGFGDDLSYRYVLARIGHRPVATAVGLVAGVGGIIINVATVPDARRRGIGRAVTLEAMHQCAAMGATVAVLQSSEMGHPVYRGLGFEDFGRYRSYARQG
jgi:ribosomal protein S18 acetylase RimI-like enzyme